MEILILIISLITLLCAVMILIKSKKDNGDAVRTEVERCMKSFGDIITICTD